VEFDSVLVFAFGNRITPDGTVIYLSTDGVARKALVLSEEVGIRLGRAAVLGHRDHVERCRRTATKVGIEIVILPDEFMPSEYDAESGQEWTRSRDVYLKADAYAMRLLNES
jgi:hypothetical protein